MVILRRGFPQTLAPQAMGNKSKGATSWDLIPRGIWLPVTGCGDLRSHNPFAEPRQSEKCQHFLPPPPLFPPHPQMVQTGLWGHRGRWRSLETNRSHPPLKYPGPPRGSPTFPDCHLWSGLRKEGKTRKERKEGRKGKRGERCGRAGKKEERRGWKVLSEVRQQGKLYVGLRSHEAELETKERRG